MRRASWFSGEAAAAPGAALLVVVALQSSATAQDTRSAELELSQVGNSGVSGTTILEDAEDGLEVTLDVEGLPEEGVEHINHFHGGGTCADVQGGENVPVTIPLTTIVANEDGTGSATTTVEDVTLAQLFDRRQDRIILLHAEADPSGGVPPAITCADVNPTTREEDRALPKSGGPMVGSVLLPAAMLLIGVGVLRYAVFRGR